MLDAAVVMRFRAGRTPLRVRAEATILGHGDAGRATARPKVLRIILGLQLAKLAAQNSVFVPKSERNFLLALCTLTLSALGRARRHAAGSPIGMAIRRRGVAAGPRGRVRRFRIRIRAAHARAVRCGALGIRSATPDADATPRSPTRTTRSTRPTTHHETGQGRREAASPRAPSPGILDMPRRRSRANCVDSLPSLSLSLNVSHSVSLPLVLSDTAARKFVRARVAREPQSADTLSRHSWSCKLSHTRHAQIPP